MAFKKRLGRIKEVQLVSCMDMIFNLLIFYLVTSYVVSNTKAEKRFVFPTPKVEVGTAEIFIQWLDESNVFWMDQSAAVEVQKALNEFSYLAAEELTPGDRVIHVDGDRDPDAVARSVAEALDAFVSSRTAPRMR